MRLDKFICKSTELSRTEAKTRILYGKVFVNGVIAKNAAMQVHENNEVKLDGKLLSARGFRYIMLHKPIDMICSNVDEVYPSILHLINVDKAFDLHIAGRLDADTTGLVLITDDGRWSHSIISPKKQCEKKYRVWLRDAIADDASAKFEEGVQLHGERALTLPAKLDIIDTNEVVLTITEGKYHQVKRMFAAIGNKVVGLHREQIGNIVLNEELPLGQWRYLTEQEVASI